MSAQVSALANIATASAAMHAVCEKSAAAWLFSRFSAASDVASKSGLLETARQDSVSSA